MNKDTTEVIEKKSPKRRDYLKILTIYDTPTVQEVFKTRGDNGLRFSELQFLLCKQQPNWSKSWPEQRGKQKRRRGQRPIREWQMEWIQRVIADTDNVLDDKRIYTDKSNLAADLRILKRDRKIKKMEERYYRAEKVDLSYFIKSATTVMKEYISEYPENQVIECDSIFYYNVSESSLMENQDTFDQMHEIIVKARRDFRNRWFKAQLDRIIITFQNELTREKSDLERIRLWKDLEAHVRIQIRNLGFHENDFTDLLNQIFEPDIGLSQQAITQLEKELESEKERYKEIMEQISMVMWNEQYHSALEAFKFMTKTKMMSLPHEEESTVWSYLQKEESFSQNLQKKGLLIPFNIPICILS